MDPVLATLPGQPDGELVLCDGIAYQADMTQVMPYDADYFAKCASHPVEMQQRINAGRVAFVAKHYGSGSVLDVGIGDGSFIRARPLTYGYDVNPEAVRWLMRRDLLADDLRGFGAYTFWDVLEHVADPQEYFAQMRSGCFLFTSIPIIADLTRVRESKHYRPNEHLVYFESKGFLWWMKCHGFDPLETATFEIDAGRESIYSYAFRKS